MNEDALEADLQGVSMGGYGDGPRALFYTGPGQPLLPDDLVCSGGVPSTLNGKPCPYSIAGRMPDPIVIGRALAQSMPELGEGGDQAPPCAVRHLGRLADWLGPKASGFATDVLDLRLFECKQMFLLVIPGLYNERGMAVGQ